MIVKKIGVLSLAKFLGGIHAAIGLLIGAVASLAALAGAAIGSAQGGDDAVPAIVGALLGVGAIILLPLLYGVMGFLGGLITAFLYNVFSSIFGGIELEVDMQGQGVSGAAMRQAPPQTSAFS